MLMTHARGLLRLALMIHRQLQPKPSPDNDMMLPDASWERCREILRRQQQAQRHGWTLAAERLKHTLRREVQECLRNMQECDRRCETPTVSSSFISLPDLLADLRALYTEFDAVTFDLRKKTLSVTTESIELDGIELGPFEIVLDWSTCAKNRLPDYYVVALEPHPAAAASSVTHPHVQDEGLCEGEGRGAIRSAFEQGRLFDFFVIVANLLRTYNDGSAYVSLSDWHGIACGDCGAHVSEDDGVTCDQCSTTVCDGCQITCPGCSDAYCHDCVTRCAACDESHCNHCLQSCADCGKEVCPQCLNEQKRCDACYEPETNESETVAELQGS